MRKSLGLALVVIGLVGCGKDSSSPPPPPPLPSISCYFAANYECDLVTASQAVLDRNGIDAASCTTSGGVAGTSCPTGQVGRCSVSMTIGTDTVPVVYYLYSPGYTQADVIAACTAIGGTFSPRLGDRGWNWPHIPLESMSLEQP